MDLLKDNTDKSYDADLRVQSLLGTGRMLFSYSPNRHAREFDRFYKSKPDKAFRAVTNVAGGDTIDVPLQGLDYRINEDTIRVRLGGYRYSEMDTSNSPKAKQICFSKIARQLSIL